MSELQTSRSKRPAAAFRSLPLDISQPPCAAPGLRGELGSACGSECGSERGSECGSACGSERGGSDRSSAASDDGLTGADVYGHLEPLRTVCLSGDG